MREELKSRRKRRKTGWREGRGGGGKSRMKRDGG